MDEEKKKQIEEILKDIDKEALKAPLQECSGSTDVHKWIDAAKEAGLSLSKEEVRTLGEYFARKAHEDIVELADNELENIAGGCGKKPEPKPEPKEYDTIGTWMLCGESCYQLDTYHFFAGGPHACGNCVHFVPNTKDDWEGPGKCRREF